MYGSENLVAQITMILFFSCTIAYNVQNLHEISVSDILINRQLNLGINYLTRAHSEIPQVIVID